MREDWEYKKLEDISSSVLIEKAKKRFSPNDVIRYIDISSIDNINQCLTGTTSFKMLDAPSRAQQKVEYGDILISTVRPNLRNIAIVNDDATNLVASSGFCVLRINDAALRRYVFYYVVSDKFTAYLEKLTNGANYPAVKETDVRKALIPIPPKSTQLSIVSELDKLNELIRIKKEQLKDYDTLAQSIFYEMFGDPVVNEKGWEVMSLGEICEITSSKRVFANEYVDMGVPFYRSKEVIEKSKQLPISVELYISESHYDKIKSSFGVPQIGDILVTAVGTIGKIWVVDTNEPFYFKDGHLVWLRKIKGVHSEYFRYSLFYLIDEYKKVNANGAAYNALTIAKLKLMLCPLPPLSLQQSFAHKIEQIERQKAAVQRTIKDLETLLAVRMQYWFE